MSNVFQRINWVDVLVVILLIRTSYIGAKNGLAIEISKIGGVLLGLYFGMRYYSEAGAWMISKIFFQQEIAEGISLLSLLLISIAALKLTGFGLSKVLKITFADKVSKWGGFLAGFLRGGLILSLLFMVCNILQAEYFVKSIEERSLTGPVIQKIAPFMYQLITRNTPENFQIKIPPKEGDGK